MDDVIDFFQYVFDSETYQSVSSAVQKGAKTVEGILAGAAAKGSAPFVWGARGFAELVDRAGLDDDQSIRRTLGLTPEELRNFQFGVRVLPNDEPSDAVRAGSGAVESGTNPPPADIVQTGVFDP